MDKQDWIILRLCQRLARSHRIGAGAHMDLSRSVMYLIDKYGDKVMDYIDMLDAEENSND